MIGFHTLVLALLLATPASAQVKTCPSGAASQTITIAGSTTVEPIAKAWGAAYKAQCGTTVTVTGGGSSDGAKRVCGVTSAGTAVDIGAMSRPWKTTEATVSTGGFTYQCVIGTRPKAIQIDVAIDGIVVILKKDSLPQKCIAALGCLTFDQLRWIFSSYTRAGLLANGWSASALANSDGNDKTHLYSELSKSCPAAEIKLTGPTSVFGTYTYFLETILTDYANGETFDTLRPSGAAYFGTTTDAATITRVGNDSTGNSIGYISYNAYSVISNVRAISLKKKATNTCVAPSATTIGTGTYPLSRRIYMNLLSTTVAKTKLLIEYGMSVKGTANVTATGFSPIPLVSRATMKSRLSIA